MNSRLRFGARFIIAAAVIFCAAFPAAAEAQQATLRPQSENLLSWEELAAHAGLTGLKSKTLKEYQVDGAYDGFRGYFDLIQASIQLTPEEWTRLESGGHPMLNPWTTGKMDHKTWKSTVDLILDAEDETDAAPKAKTFDYEASRKGATVYHSGAPPRGRKVDTNRLEMNDKAVLLYRPDLHSTRLYILSPNPDGKSGVLYYFYMRHTP
ncbi:hypothetical protein [Prosthecobacter sp.]|uniref:hypothetical protein n=1 Tax=Prosthecobacter sp. TaxID=1965333 RepID=UPI0037847DF1